MSRINTASLILALIALIAVVELGLLPALFSGLLIYQLVQFGLPLLQRLGINHNVGRSAVLTLLVIIIGTGISFGVIQLVSFMTRGPSSLVVLLQKMADVIDPARAGLPDWIQEYLPANTRQLERLASKWFSEHAEQVRLISQNVGTVTFRIVIGMIIGGMITYHKASSQPNARPFTHALSQRAARLASAFQKVCFSQLRISALNTTLTSIYLVGILPLFGISLPFVGTIIMVTFIVGLLPILGNLISNTVIVIVSLSISPAVAIASLGFLIGIHKLEYFMNAHIIGGQIRAHAWELLTAMIVMEAAFGLAGLIAAPIYYAYLKEELAACELI